MGKKVRYSSSLITYLDVLGFRNLIEHKTAGEISRVLRILKETTKPDEEVAKAYEMKFFNFSDTTVRITPLDTPSNVKYRSGCCLEKFSALSMCSMSWFYKESLLVVLCLLATS